MDFGRYKVSVILILVVLIIAVFIWKRKGSEKMNGKKGKKEKFAKKGSKKAPHQERVSKDDDGDDDDYEKPPGRAASGNVADDAKELFDLVHNDMASGMQIDAFEDAAGDLAGDDPSETFVNLKQKYTQAIDDNRDPMRAVSVKDYVQILQKS